LLCEGNKSNKNYFKAHRTPKLQFKEMKKLYYTLCLLSLTVGVAIAQETYTQIYDNPEDVIKGHIGVEWYGVDVGFNNIDGSMLFVAGVNAAYTVSPNLFVNAEARLPLLRFEKVGMGFILEGGASFLFNTSSKKQTRRIILGYKESDAGGGKRVATTKYVDLEGMVKRSLILRGGIYLKNTTIVYNEKGTTLDYDPENLFHKGIYVGIGRQKQYFSQLERNSDDGKIQHGAGTIFRPYLDVMILPAKVDVTVNTFGFGTGAKKNLTGLIGVRAGFKWYRNPFTRKQNFDHRIPFFGNSVIHFEGGIRPMEGIFVSSGLSYIIHIF
jgi:hypothetical protein